MSTLVAQTISNGTVSTSSANVIQGSARAWVSFNGNSGASPVIRSSFNVSSVTRTATGTYTVTMTNAMQDAEYAVVLGCGGRTSNPGDQAGESMYDTPTTTVFKIATNNSTTALTDIPYVYAAVFR